MLEILPQYKNNIWKVPNIYQLMIVSIKHEEKKITRKEYSTLTSFNKIRFETKPSTYKIKQNFLLAFCKC